MVLSQDRLIFLTRYWNSILSGSEKKSYRIPNIQTCLYEFEGFQFAIWGYKILFLVLSQKSSCKNISYPSCTCYTRHFFPVSLKVSYKVAHLLSKRTKSWITSVHLGKKKNEKFHNVNRNEIFHSIYEFH